MALKLFYETFERQYYLSIHATSVAYNTVCSVDTFFFFFYELYFLSISIEYGTHNAVE